MYNRSDRHLYIPSIGLFDLWLSATQLEANMGLTIRADFTQAELHFRLS